MSKFKRPHRSTFNEGFSFERLLTAPFRMVTAVFLSVTQSSGHVSHDAPFHVKVGQFLGGLLLLPFMLLYYIAWFAIFKWASSRHAMSFVIGLPAFVTCIIFAGLLIWLLNINSKFKLRGYLKRSQDAEVRQNWDRMVKSLTRRVVSDPSMDNRYMLMQSLNLRNQRVEDREVEVTGSPKRLAELKSDIFTDEQRVQMLLDQLAPDNGVGFWRAHFEKAERLNIEYTTKLKKTGEADEELLEQVKMHYKKMLDIVEDQAEGVNSATASRYQSDRLAAAQRLGDIYATEENWHEARKYYLTLNNFDTRFASLLVQIERKLAEYTAENGINEPTDSPDYWNKQADFHFLTAEEKLTEKLGQDRRSYGHYRGLANLYVVEDRHEDAVKFLEREFLQTSELIKKRKLGQFLGIVNFAWYNEKADEYENLEELKPTEFAAQLRRLIDAIFFSPLTDRYYRKVWEDGWLDFPIDSVQTKAITRESLLGRHAFAVDCMLATKYLIEDEQTLARQKLRIANKQESGATPIVIAKLANARFITRPEMADRCQHVYDVLTEISPNNYHLLRFQADFFLWQEKYPDAIRYLEVSVERQADLDGLMFLAICHRILGNQLDYEYYRNLVNDWLERADRTPADFNKLMADWQTMLEQRNTDGLDQNQVDEDLSVKTNQAPD